MNSRTSHQAICAKRGKSCGIALTAPHDTRHTRLKGGLAIYTRKGVDLPHWQIEVTSGGRIWYALDTDAHTVWITYASPRHPKETDC